MARLMFSAGMFSDLASAMMVRRRGFMSGSPPPARAATVSSLMIRVKILPRLASRAPFLCLMEAHLEWPDMAKTPLENGENEPKCYHFFSTCAGAPPPARTDADASLRRRLAVPRHGRRRFCPY